MALHHQSGDVPTSAKVTYWRPDISGGKSASTSLSALWPGGSPHKRSPPPPTATGPELFHPHWKEARVLGRVLLSLSFRCRISDDNGTHAGESAKQWGDQRPPTFPHNGAVARGTCLKQWSTPASPSKRRNLSRQQHHHVKKFNALADAIGAHGPDCKRLGHRHSQILIPPRHHHLRICRLGCDRCRLSPA